MAPVTVQLAPGQMTSTVTIANQTAEPATMQIRAFQWTQADGIETLTPTADLAVSPPITSIGAGQSQLFRLVLRRPASTAEASYRVLLDQLPPPATPGTVRMAIRISIPVFAQPAARMEKDLTWRIATGLSGGELIGANHGGQHVRVLNPVLSQPPGVRLAVIQGSSPYILPGAEQRWRIQSGARLNPGATLRLEAVSDAGPIDAMVHVAGP